MRSILRTIVMTGLLGLTLASCADFNVDKLDLDSLDVFGLAKKKPIPGDRKDVFPQGVPGVSQGVPPELMKGYQAPTDTAVTDPATLAAAKVAQEEKPPPKPKPKKTAKVTPTKPVQQTGQTQQQSQSGGTAPWPSQQQSGQTGQSGQQAQAPWPSQTNTQQTAPWPGTTR
jgi:hypothetical protein